jgi:hypothetical protein
LKDLLSGQRGKSGYRTYLLTCWQERDALTDISVWRFRLETPVTGKRRLFALLEDVMVWIEGELLLDHQHKDNER